MKRLEESPWFAGHGVTPQCHHGLTQAAPTGSMHTFLTEAIFFREPIPWRSQKDILTKRTFVHKVFHRFI